MSQNAVRISAGDVPANAARNALAMPCLSSFIPLAISETITQGQYCDPHPHTREILDLPELGVDVPEIDAVGVSDRYSSSSFFGFLRKLNLLFFFFSEAAGESASVPVLVLERIGVLPFGLVGLAGCGVCASATPKTCNASCHNSCNFSSCTGVRFPGRPGGAETAISSIGGCEEAGIGDSVGVGWLNARENPTANPMDAPIATVIATAAVKLMLFWYIMR